MNDDIILLKPIKGRVRYDVRKYDGFQYGKWENLDIRDNLVTNLGAQFAQAQIGSYNSASTGAPFIALSQDATAPAIADTTLTGEIATGGLSRVGGSFTAGSAVGGTVAYTLINTFTASSIFNTVQKSGLFTASSSGTMFAENTFTSSTLQINDQIKVTWTVTV